MNENQLLIIVKKNSFYSFLFLLTTILTACGESIDSVIYTATPATDISDVILTNLSANCVDYIGDYQSTSLDVNRNFSFNGSLTITLGSNSCVFSTNDIPNHSFNDGIVGFVNNVAEQALIYEITRTPNIAVSTTALSLGVDNAIFLNGVKLDILATACYGVGDGKVGCTNMSQPWRYDPMSSLNDFTTDSHNAHTQPDGAYHYHGSPVALFDSNTPLTSPVIGFAADGFPIFGSYFYDGSSVRKAISSYQLKVGSRGVLGDTNPGGNYDGSYRDDYLYSNGSGDLDICNGMTVNGVYGYYVTDTYPWVMACFKGLPNVSFNK